MHVPYQNIFPIEIINLKGVQFRIMIVCIFCTSTLQLEY